MRGLLKEEGMFEIGLFIIVILVIVLFNL